MQLRKPLKSDPLPSERTRPSPFPNFPPQSVIDDFRAWVIETGRPDLWLHHDPSSPPRDAEFDEVLRFVIPESKRADVGRATCPICSPLAPKYYEGSLAWFRGEGVLRAIGHECAKSHFGEAAVARSKFEGQRRRAEDYLLATLPLAGNLKMRARALKPVAAAMDSLRSVLLRAGSKSAWTRIAKLGAGGSLPIEKLEEIHIVDGFGKASSRMEARTVNRVPVDGLSFIIERFLTAAEAHNAVAAAELINTCTAEEALDLVIQLSPRMDDLLDAERLLRSALAAVEQLERKVADARAFLSPANLQRLSDWTLDLRVDAGLVVSFSMQTPFQFKVRSPPREWRTLPVPPELRPAR
ncbi:hypothetical protein AB4099_05600 [Bosea sp. 2KB_26]|uniref:hypothetical protein n=1 Tax=Bosea sp. 2KB_26 TaxID=3237475 RepID=UPI003F8FD7B3